MTKGAADRSRRTREPAKRVALISIGDARDVRAWSGIPFYVWRALEAVGVEVTLISPLAVARPRVAYARWRAAGLLGRSYRPELEKSAIRAFARTIENGLAHACPDVAICLSSVPLAALETDIPVAAWVDATLPLLTQTYREYAKLGSRLRRRGLRHEAAALHRADMVFCASTWARESVRLDFGIPGERLGIAPFGANLAAPPDEATVAAAVAARQKGPCRLIFIGVDWERKRGDFAIAVASCLHHRGRDVELRMFGATPPTDRSVPSYVRLEGFVDKHSVTGSERLERALLEADVLLLPSRAECFGIVVAEANAAGVPCLGSAVGGIIDAIAPGRNGWLLGPDAEPRDFADAVTAIIDDPAAYATLARSSRAEFSSRLNWDASVSAILHALSA